jgi:hypothetical protein
VVAVVLKRLVLALALAPAWACAADLPASFHIAPEVLHLRINGVSVNSRVLTSTLEPSSACIQIARQWQRTGNHGQIAPCQRAGSWLLITHRAGNALQTAQLQGAGVGSAGFLSEVGAPASNAAGTWPQLPLPVGARLVNTVQSVLDGDSVTQFTIELPWTPAASLMRVRKVARERGWGSIGGPATGVADFQRGELAVRAIALPGARGCTLVLVEHRPAGPGQ